MLLFIDFCGCPWWLPWLLAFLLGLLLGWLIWGRLKNRILELEEANASLKGRITELEGELAACRSSKAGMDSQIALLEGRLRELSSQRASSGADKSDSPQLGIIGAVAAAESASRSLKDSGDVLPTSDAGLTAVPPITEGSKRNPFAALKSDNLQVVEGIGPKMSEVLNNSGITTWANLAAKTPGDLRAVLDAANAKRYRIIDPATWPEQAKLADSGQWDALIHMQKNLDTGRAGGATGETDSKVEKLLIKLGVLKRWKQDDLTAVEGIGPKISGLLKDAGITTWRMLANTEVSKIQSILDAAGKRFKLADPATWPKQAEMAADGRWDDLQEYQDFLQGGK